MTATRTFLIDLLRMPNLKSPPAAIPIVLFAWAVVALIYENQGAASRTIFNPVVRDPISIVLTIVAVYSVALTYSGRVVRFFILPKGAPASPPPKDGHRFDISTLIGKCENIIAVTASFGGNLAGLAIIFAAKSWVRAKEIEQNPTFYLGGTLVNLTWSLFCGGVARVLVFGV